MNLKHTTVECAKIPSACRNKAGWFENHQKHICLTKEMQSIYLLNLLLLGFLGTRIFGKHISSL